MTRYTIKHIPSGKYIAETEGGIYLIDEEDGVISVGKRELADDFLKHIYETYDYPIGSDIIQTEDGDFNKSEFEVVIF